MQRQASGRAGRVAGMLTLGAVWAAPAAAQESPLDALVREALAGNLAVRQERLAEQRGEAAVREARALYLPSLALDARYTRTDGGVDIGDLVNPAYQALNQLTGSAAFPTDVDARLPLAQETRLRLTQPLFQPALRHNHALARSQRGALSAGARTAERRLAAEVQAAYLQHAQAVRVVELYRATLPLLDENLRVSESLVANGKATSEGIYRARAEKAETEQRLAEAELRRDAAARFLNFLLDRPTGTPVEVFADTLLAFPPAPGVEDAVRTALARREELRQAGHAIEAAEAQRRLAAAGRLPGVSLALDYGIQGQEYRFDADHDVASATLLLQWTVQDGGQTSARRQAAALDAERARAARAEAARRVEMQVRQAHDAVSVARAAIRTADARLAAARRTFELVSRRYEEGIAPQVEYVDARTAYTAAGLNAIVTRHDYLLRRVDLEHAAALRDLPAAPTP